MSVHYDPMIAKMIVWGDDRNEALKKADAALSEFHVGGVSTNIDFMRRILQSKAFRDDLVTTKFIEENHDELLTVKELTSEQLAMAALAFCAISDFNSRGSEIFAKRFRVNSPLNTVFEVKSGDKVCKVDVSHSENGTFTVQGLQNCQILRLNKIGHAFELDIIVGDKKETITTSISTDNMLSVFTTVSCM